MCFFFFLSPARLSSLVVCERSVPLGTVFDLDAIKKKKTSAGLVILYMCVCVCVIGIFEQLV